MISRVVRIAFVFAAALALAGCGACYHWSRCGGPAPGCQVRWQKWGAQPAPMEAFDDGRC